MKGDETKDKALKKGKKATQAAEMEKEEAEQEAEVEEENEDDGKETETEEENGEDEGSDVSDDYSTEDINAMKKKELQKVVEEYDLDVDTKQSAPKIRAEIIEKYFEEKPEPEPEPEKKSKKEKKEKTEKIEKTEKKKAKSESSKKMNKYDAACTALKNNPKSFEKALKNFTDLYDIKESSARSYMKIVLKILEHFDVKFDY